MSTTITIFDPNEKPFGQLSNNYRHKMSIKGSIWYTVSQFIYVSILKNQLFKNQLLDAPKKYTELFYKLYEQEFNDVTKKAIQISLKEKFKNVQLSSELEKTGDNPIFYVSQYEFLW